MADGEDGASLRMQWIYGKPVAMHALMLLASNCASASCSPQGRLSACVNTFARQLQHNTKGNMFIMSILVI